MSVTYTCPPPRMVKRTTVRRHRREERKQQPAWQHASLSHHGRTIPPKSTRARTLLPPATKTSAQRWCHSSPYILFDRDQHGPHFPGNPTLVLFTTQIKLWNGSHFPPAVWPLLSVSEETVAQTLKSPGRKKLNLMRSTPVIDPVHSPSRKNSKSTSTFSLEGSHFESDRLVISAFYLPFKVCLQQVILVKPQPSSANLLNTQ